MRIKRILVMLLAICLVIGCCGCDGIATVTPVVSGNEGVQYVIALNPSLSFDDTTVSSIRNSTSASIQTDMTSGKAESLYNTPWRWLKHTESGEWDVRKLRTVSVWRDGAGTQKSGAPYSYTVTDSGLSSLAIFDSTKMDVKGVNEGELPKSGVIMSFTGNEEESLTYFAGKDCIADLTDRDGGNIAIVSSIAGASTDFTKAQGAKKALVLRIYKNNRIYWQEVLDSTSTAVAFPTFLSLELKEGQAISITVQAMDDTSGIIRGNCDLPATTATVIEKTPIETQVEAVEPATGIPFVNEDGESNFTIIRPQTISDSESNILTQLRNGMRNALGIDVDYKNDEFDFSGNRIFVYKTRYDASKTALDEIVKARKNNAADFIIRLVGKDVVIAADTEIGIEYAIEFFLNNYCKGPDDEIPFELNYVSSKFNANKTISLAGTPLSDYRVVVSSVASFMETQAANELVKNIARLSGIILPVVRDEHVGAKDKEILIGNTNRANYNGVADYTNTTYYNSDAKYKISVGDKYTSVLGSHIYGVNAGVLKFVELLEKNTSIKKGYSFEGEYDGGYSLVDGYKLTWADDFDTNTLSSYWTVTHHRGDVRENDYGGISRNIKPTFRNGAMIQAIEKQGNDIYFSDVSTLGANAMNFMWGYVEKRVKLAVSPGVCGSIWTKASVTGGFLEADIYESFGDPYNVKHNLHTWEDSGHKNLLGSRGDTLNNAPGSTTPEPYGIKYHTIGWEWNDDYSTFYVDGQPTITLDSTASALDVFNKPCWLIVSTVEGESTYGKLLPTDFTYDEVCVDYVHIYQQDNGSVMYIKQ